MAKPTPKPDQANPTPEAETHNPPQSRGSADTPPQLHYQSCTLRLDQVDAQSMRHIYCHREGPSMAWNDDKDAAPDNLRSLGESLLSEGQIVPIEFYKSGDNNILVRGYRLIEAIQQIIARALDPEHFHPSMEIKAVEITGGAEADYLVRAVASNEVRCALTPEAQYKAAAMLLDRGVSATRGSRALGISATLFARYVRRHNNPWMSEHVRQKHIEQAHADDLLESASNVNQVPVLKEGLDAYVTRIQDHISTQKARAEATKQKWDDEKQGVVKHYIKKQIIEKWCKAFDEGKHYTPDLSVKPPGWTFVCEIDSKDGKLKVVGLNGLALSQKSYSDLGLIAGRLNTVASQVESLWLAAKARAAVASNGNADQALINYYRAKGADDLADALQTKLKAETGEDDPTHGVVNPRSQRNLAAQIEEPAEHDSAIDDGPTS